jgi:hypothetical protein
LLPFGSLRPLPCWGDPRRSRLTGAETRTAFTLWAIARSPLILGGNLTEMGAPLRALLTNADVIALNQEKRTSRPLDPPPGLGGEARLWLSGPNGGAADTLAIFNLSDTPLRMDARWPALGLADGRVVACDLWSRSELPSADNAALNVAPHDVVLLRVRAVRDGAAGGARACSAKPL